MKSAFHIVCSEGASVLTKEERQVLATEAVQQANTIKPSANFFILSDDRGLKIVVRLSTMEVWIMANEEADAGGLPSERDN